MKAIVFDDNLKLDTNYTKPAPESGEALIRVHLAGICNTDYEITKGYMGYKGVLGHEFVGVVEEVNSENKSDKEWVGKRVVAEISYGCEKPDCEWCAKKNYRHCPNRHTLGIWRKDGVFAQYFTMPIEVLFEVPDNVPDTQAVFVEPLAAALEILEQHHIKPYEKVVVLEKAVGKKITDPQEIQNPNYVKIAMGLKEGQNFGRALYFSRSPIPFNRDNDPSKNFAYWHIRIYVYRIDALKRFVATPVGILESTEKLEQLRALENGMKIYALIVPTIKLIEAAPTDINTPEELAQAQKFSF